MMRRARKLPCDVYKTYGMDGSLLYVGISVNVFKRLPEHKGYSAWYPLTQSIQVTQYPTRRSARAEEARCIRDDSPQYNVAWARLLDSALSSETIDSFTMVRTATGWAIDD